MSFGLKTAPSQFQKAMEDSTKHVENIDPSAQACKSTDLNI